MVDHDYNFLSSIERDVARTDREIVEARGLFARGDELFGEGRGAAGARGVNRGSYGRGRGGGGRGKSLSQMSFAERLDINTRQARVDVRHAPKGMQRKVENGTSWSKAQRCINWTVEWITESGERKLGTCLEKWPVAKAWGEMLHEEKMRGLSQGERKRWRDEREKERSAKRRRVNSVSRSWPIISQTILQNSETAAWNQAEEFEVGQEEKEDEEEEEPAWKRGIVGYYFYLLRPNTPIKLPKVLIPVSSSQTLADTLKDRTVLEFPTVFALSKGPDELGNLYMTEKQYMNRKRSGNGTTRMTGLVAYSSEEDSGGESSSSEDNDDENNESEGSSDGAEEDDTTSDDASDEDMEDGEIS